MKKMITRRNFLKAAGVSAAALGLAACGGSSSSTASSAASSTAASSTAAKADGKVYYLNFKPEQDQDWQDPVSYTHLDLSEDLFYCLPIYLTGVLLRRHLGKERLEHQRSCHTGHHDQQDHSGKVD